MKLIVKDYENHMPTTILKLIGILLIAFTIQAATVYAEEETTTTTTTQNIQELIDSQKVCKFIDKSNVGKDNYYLTVSGHEQSLSNWIITPYINIKASTIKMLENLASSSVTSYCFYNKDKTLISCTKNTDTQVGPITIPDNSVYVRFSISKTSNKPQFEICTNVNQATYDLIKEIEKLVMAIIIIMIIALIIK